MHDYAFELVLALKLGNFGFRLKAMGEHNFVKLNCLRPFACSLYLETPLGVVRITRSFLDCGIENPVLGHIEVIGVVFTVLLELIRSQENRILCDDALSA